MTTPNRLSRFAAELDYLRQAGTYKHLKHLTTPTSPIVNLEDKQNILLLCANNYLGLANHPDVIAAGKRGLDQYGAGTASVRFICGTFTIHKDLERRLAAFFRTEAALTYVSAWNANEGVIPTLLGEGDAVISDALNHASIIDAIRLTRGVARGIYKHADADDLRARLEEHKAARTKLIVTDGVFSMEGDLAPLPAICQLADEYGALVMVDDSHGTGVLGDTGRGTAEHFGLLDRIDITTSTLGKALGGAAGGFVCASHTIVDYLVQRSRPQLFSNALPPTVAASALAALDVLEREPDRVRRLRENAAWFRAQLKQLGYKPLESESAIIPIIVGDTAVAIRLSKQLYDDHGVFVIGFGYPVVPEGTARLRVQLSAAHTREHLQRALDAFSALRAALPT
ncbi:MAG TPA: glycine C-acetyltransferase [Chloroflexota bacterium]|nr:glycine C-acetyltransferase [Chloroflexota bacterium]